MAYSPDDARAIQETARRLGVSPGSLAGLFELESGGDPNIWGGAGGKYRGLIQFGPGARSEVGLPDGPMTVSQQLPYVERYFQQRGFKPGQHGTRELYRTVLVGNPYQSGTDSNGTNSDSAAARMSPGGDLYERGLAKLGGNGGALPLVAGGGQGLSPVGTEPLAALGGPMAGFTQQLLSGFAPKPLPVANTLGELAALGLETSFAEAAGLKGRGSRGTRMALSPEFIAGYSDLKQRQQEAGGDLLSQSISRMFGPQAAPGAPVSPAAAPASVAGGSAAGILDLAAAAESAGLRARGHPALPGGVGRHAPNSLHYAGNREGKGQAIDVTDWQFPDEGQASWLPRKKFLGEQIAGILGGINAEVLHPGNDPVGHGTHIHVGLRQPELLTTGHIDAIVKARQESLRQFPARWAG